MIRQSTIDKLHDLRLSAMSDAFECQCRDPETYQGLSFEDRFGMLVDKEWDKRKSTKLQKLIRSAEFRYPNACMEDIEYHPDRNLDKGQMLEFSPCRYISDDHHTVETNPLLSFFGLSVFLFSRTRPPHLSMCAWNRSLQELYQSTLCTSAGSIE